MLLAGREAASRWQRAAAPVAPGGHVLVHAGENAAATGGATRIHSGYGLAKSSGSDALSSTNGGAAGQSSAVVFSSGLMARGW